MIKINREQERGRGNYGWLQANYSFSFSQYYNPKKLGYKDLLVINEDFVQPKSGFPTHPHKNMEILTIVLSGQLGHTDSMGNIKTLNPGKIQRMYAGSGVRHSEFNLSDSEVLNLLQIWIKPTKENIPSEYMEKDFDFSKKFNLLTSPQGDNGSIKAYINAEVFLLNLKSGQSYDLDLNQKSAYLHTIKGDLSLNNQTIHYGDSAEVEGEDLVTITAKTDGWILGFKFLD